MEQLLKDVSYTVSESNPIAIKLEKGTEVLLNSVSAKGVSGDKPTVLSAEFSDIACGCCAHEGKRETVDIAEFKADCEGKDFIFLASDEMDAKLMVSGPGEVTVKGYSGPTGIFDIGEEEEDILIEEEEEELPEKME